MRQNRTQKKLRRLALALLVLTLVIALVGILIHGSRANHAQEIQTFSTADGLTEMQLLASFPEFDPNATTVLESVTPPETSETADATDGTIAATTVPSSVVPSTSQSASDTTAATGTTVHGYAAGEEYAYAYAGYTPQIANLDIADWRLLLVNRNYMLPQDYSPALAEAAAGTGVRMDARVAPYYQKMYDAAKADGITLTPLSGHRRISTQKRNFENKIQTYMNQGYDRATATQKAATIILPPGTSEHNAGLSMDIISLDVSFENTKAFAWLKEHAAEYGFVLRYPKDKENITEITYEPWHWRYVGAEHAKAMNERNQCLEEYVGAVR